MTPRATMRLQFHKGFTFADAEAPGALLRRARHQPSLCLADHDRARRARRMATTSIDPTRVNPELGGEEGSAAARRCIAAA